MPNRVLRDWTDSEKIENLTDKGEVFFTRLIMKVDDFGKYTANPKLLNSALFPLKEYTPDDIMPWIKECTEAELIQVYTVKNKNYILIKEFGQRKRIMQSKYPDPPTDGQPADVTPAIEVKGKEEKQNTNNDLIEAYFKDLPNSSQLERTAKNIQIDLEVLKKRIPDFKKHAELSYPNFDRFVTHFKNWVLKNPATDSNTKTSVTFGKHGKKN